MLIYMDLEISPINPTNDGGRGVLEMSGIHLYLRVDVLYSHTTLTNESGECSD